MWQQPGQQEAGGAYEEHPEQTQRVVTENIDHGGSFRRGGPDKSIVPSIAVVEDGQRREAAESEDPGVAEIGPVWSVARGQHLGEAQQDEEMIAPEHPESHGGVAELERRGEESPNAQRQRPEIENRLPKADVSEDGGGTDEVGEVAELEGQSGCPIKARRQVPEKRVGNPGQEAAPANEEVQPSQRGIVAPGCHAAADEEVGQNGKETPQQGAQVKQRAGYKLPSGIDRDTVHGNAFGSKDVHTTFALSWQSSLTDARTNETLGSVDQHLSVPAC